MEIIPAILPKDFAEIEDKVGQVKGLVRTVQVDICDGKFVPSFTWPYKKRDENYEAILREERGMPCWEDIDFEFDLMVAAPETVIDDWITAGAARIIIHAESTTALGAIVDQYASTIELGIALNIDTPIDVLVPYIERIAFVQCMGIVKIGFQGQKFEKKVLEKISAIKARWSETIVSVDGGVSPESASLLTRAGAVRLVAGSAIFGSDHIAEEIQRFASI